MYYIKQLQSQELGSPKPDGSVSRGRYMLISKSHNGFFPPLSETEKNDTVMLPLVAPNSNKKIYCSFVYHNDKYHGSTANQPRDEFRIYLNREIDSDRRFFQPKDIIVFEKILDIQEDEQEQNYFYKLHLFRQSNDKYDFLQEIINKTSEQKGGHAVYQKSLDFITQIGCKAEELEAIISDDVKHKAYEKQKELVEVDDCEDSFESNKGANLFNSVSFRDFVMLGYGKKCAITGEVIAYRDLINLEAAHIKPKSHSGPFLPCNGIAMCRDMHWAFDKGMFTINDNYCIQVHDKVKQSILAQYDNKPINLPIEDFFKPEPRYLEYHRKNIFGLFLHSGGIRSKNI